jgi:hypothetical protein
MTAMNDPDEFVTVKDFIEQVDAQMAKSALESAGIECFLLGENTNSLLGAAFFAQLQVHKKDEVDAVKILASSDPSEDLEVEGETDERG